VPDRLLVLGAVGTADRAGCFDQNEGQAGAANDAKFLTVFLQRSMTYLARQISRSSIEEHRFRRLWGLSVGRGLGHQSRCRGSVYFVAPPKE
jgi:hypothetical protein